MSIMFRKPPEPQSAGWLVKSLRAAWGCLWQHREPVAYVITLLTGLVTIGGFLGWLLLLLLRSG